MSEKKRGLAEYLAGGGLSQDMQDLSLNPPLTLTKWGGDALHAAGGYASEKLKPLGAALDQKLGTTGEQEDAASPDVFARKPLLPGDAEPAPEAADLAGYLGLDPYALKQPGLFEGLGQGMPVAAAAIAENEMTPGPKKAWKAPGIATSTPADRTRGYAERLAKIDPKTLKGAPTGFPSPKQSHAAMQEEAVFRDAMEAKGARPVEYAAPVSVDAQYGPIPGTNPHKLGSRAAYDENVRQMTAQSEAIAANEARGGSGSHWGSLRGAEIDANDWSATGVRGYGPERTHAWPEYGSTPPVGPVAPDASELERYLAGLYGPKAK